MSNQSAVAVTYGIDLGKTWFHVVGLDSSGKPVKKGKFNRSGVRAFFVNVPRALIGMEACSGAHHWARLFAMHGHRVRLKAPKFAAPYRLSGKAARTTRQMPTRSARP